MILDHYSETQGRRVLQMMQSKPTELLTEMWRALRNFNLTQLQMTKARGQEWSKLADHQQSELMSETYQTLYPAVETSAADEMTHAQRQKLDDWLESLAPAHSA